MLPLRILSALEALRYELLPPARGYAVIWGGRGELNAQENRVTVCPNIPVVSTATLVVHYLDENSGFRYAISITRGTGSRLPAVPRNVL